MYDAFISYSRQDQSVVEGLKLQLDKRRLRVFLDLKNLRAGEDWPPQLRSAMQGSRMMVLCWSAQAEKSGWVEAEINFGLAMDKPVIPWLLDSTPLPAMLQQKHGIHGTDPAGVVKEIAEKRKRFHRRRALGLVILASLWFSSREQAESSFRGHVVDEQGNAVAYATVESDGVRAVTNGSGEFVLILPGSPSKSINLARRVQVSKAGYQSRIIETQSDVPDLGVILDKDR